MYWAYYYSSDMTTYYTECNSMTATEFAHIVSAKTGRSLTASDIQKVNRQSDLDNQLNVTHI